MNRFILAAALALALAAGLAAPTAAKGSRVNYQTLIRVTNDFGYWMTYYARSTATPRNQLASPAIVNANIAKYVSIRSNLPSALRVGYLTGRMHLMNIPSGYRFHVDSYSDARAVETIRWLFGTNPHTPVVRVVWSFSPVGWSITQATFLRLS